ncbi:MAG: CBS domain-containing protein [Methanomicrobia archaeon]|nr:CBS domain-containing protein [Methanomicrobia archaeon]
MKVREIMTRPIVTEDEDAPVIKIARDMKELNIGSVVITREGSPTGIITERNIALHVLLKDRKASEVTAKEIMSFPLTTIESDASVEEACDLVAKSNIKRLPVVENGVLIGIVTLRNILTRKPEYIKRFYPGTRTLASGWTLDRLERSFSECEGIFAGNNIKHCKQKMKEVSEELSDLASYYVDDKELRDLYIRMKELYQDVDESEDEAGISMGDLKKRLEEILRKFRHTMFMRKRQSFSSFSGSSWLRDLRRQKEKKRRLPYKRTRPL